MLFMRKAMVAGRYVGPVAPQTGPLGEPDKSAIETV